MDHAEPVVQLRARFVDDLVAREVAAALNQWFRWILEGSEPPVPEAFEALGVSTAEHAWRLAEDVDWELGPHARALGEEVRVDLETYDTHLRLSGLLRALGAHSAVILREADL